MRLRDGATRWIAADTIAGAVEAARRQLVGSSSTPWLDARLLASHVTGLDASAIVAYGDNRLPPRRREQLQALTNRRAAGEPVAYLIGFKEFCGLRIDVDHRVLVPRPETEELVLAVAEDWRAQPIDILELGTGSGAIACALAHMLPRATIVATDASQSALEVAQTNVEQLGLSDRISLVCGDLFAPLPSDQRFDAIVANLPYVADDDPDLAPDVRAHEPALALNAGPDGLALYRRMFEAAPQGLRSSGRLYCECGPSTAAGVAGLARVAFPDRGVQIRNDASGRERFVIVV